MTESSILGKLGEKYDKIIHSSKLKQYCQKFFQNFLLSPLSYLKKRNPSISYFGYITTFNETFTY